MSKAIIQTSEVSIGDDSKSVEVVAAVLDGEVSPGMSISIELNGSFAITVPIIQVLELADNQLKLILDCEDHDGASMIEALNFADETLDVQ